MPRRPRRRRSRFRPLWMLLLAVTAAGLVFVGAVSFLHWRDLRYPPGEAIAAFAGRMADPAFIEKGRYLAAAGDCVACHTAEGGRPFAGGLGLATPFGTVYAPNITPDHDTGIGAWTDAEFVRALHKGLGKGGENLYPAFPYPAYTKLSLEDALAIKAYLFSLEPVSQRVPPTRLEFPFDQRALLMFWNLFFLDQGRFRPDPARDAAWNRGAYLVEALGHCGDCHTPRNVLQGPSGDRFAGARIENWWAHNITPAPNAGIGGWSDSDLEQYLASGVAPGRARASGPMANVVQHSTSLLRDEDRRAMVAYLRSIPPVEHGARRPRNAWGGPAVDVVAFRGAAEIGGGEAEGARLYVGNCASCHGWSGAGVGSNPGSGYPSLFRNGNVGGTPANNVLLVILQGVSRKVGEGEAFMPPFSDTLDDGEIAALANYVLRQFGSPATATVRPEEVAALRKGK